MHQTEHAIVRPGERVIAIVGNYGSGKTELSVNLALQLARAGRRVQIADLDIVNPYFRCREARVLMEAHDIRVVVPPGAQVFADLPIILPEIRGMLRPPDGVVTILDVGGDDVGARALASFRTSIADGEYELWQVINAKRPFTDTVDGCLRMKRAVEEASRWTVTGLLANSHLIDETTPGTVLDGWRWRRPCGRGRACRSGSWRRWNGWPTRRNWARSTHRSSGFAATCCRRGSRRRARPARRRTIRRWCPRRARFHWADRGRFHTRHPKETPRGPNRH